MENSNGLFQPLPQFTAVYGHNPQSTILAEFHPMSEQEKLARLNHAKTRYHFDRFSEPLREAIIAYQEKVDQLLHDYHTSRGIVLRLFKSNFRCSTVGR